MALLTNMRKTSFILVFLKKSFNKWFFFSNGWNPLSDHTSDHLQDRSALVSMKCLDLEIREWWLLYSASIKHCFTVKYVFNTFKHCYYNGVVEMECLSKVAVCSLSFQRQHLDVQCHLQVAKESWLLMEHYICKIVGN